MEISTERRDTNYNYSDSSTNEQQGIRFTYRKYLGTDCKTSKENVAIKQQLELMRMCEREVGRYWSTEEERKISTLWKVKGKQKKIPETVSYTHLTLPTKRIV